MQNSHLASLSKPWGGFMASRTVWIVGGLVVAIGAVAYLSYNKAPAGKDAAGTIVEAKRARADGTNSFNPSPTASTTDQNASDASKAMAGPDAAKDAATAAGPADNSLGAAGRGLSGRAHNAAESADAAAAAGSGDNAKKGMDASMHMRTSDSADAAAAARGVGSSAQIKGQASAKSGAMASHPNAMEGADKQ
jgi:hypothetical protein